MNLHFAFTCPPGCPRNLSGLVNPAKLHQTARPWATCITQRAIRISSSVFSWPLAAPHSTGSPASSLPIGAPFSWEDIFIMLWLPGPSVWMQEVFSSLEMKGYLTAYTFTFSGTFQIISDIIDIFTSLTAIIGASNLSHRNSEDKPASA